MFSHSAKAASHIFQLLFAVMTMSQKGMIFIMKKSNIVKDTIILTAISLVLQSLSLLLNIFITKKLGTSAIGIASLIYSFYAFVIILANGNIFTSTSRFVSEEIGKGNGNVEKIVGYALKFSMVLSCLFAIVIFIFAPKIGLQFLKSSSAVIAIRILAISIPLATVGSCLKGYFHAMRLVKKPCISDVIEFFIKAIILWVFVAFFIPNGKIDIFTAISISMVFGEVASCIYLSVSYYLQKPEKKSSASASIKSFWKYLIAIFPIVISAYIFVALSSANEALVPLTLKQFSGSTETALSEYGIFEAIILPIMFFPSIILQSLSCILVPEIAREKSAQRLEKVRYLTKKVLLRGFSWSILVASILFAYGSKIGVLTCDDPLVGKTLMILCPIIPFIYLEIVLEGILKGMGMQNFSTINSAAEYILRISAVLICVPLMGFNGIIVSYFISNVICNIVRIVAVLKATELEFDFTNFIFVPLFSAGVGWQISLLFVRALKIPQGLFNVAIYIMLSCLIYFITKKLLMNFTTAKIKTA